MDFTQHISSRLSSVYSAKDLTDIANADEVAITADIITNAAVHLHYLEDAVNDDGLCERF